jgi:predicted PurR-regulated permease PerM
MLLPHVGDPRTVLTPVWTTVGVTIGGGVAGFIGMLVAIPLAATIHQLIIIGAKRRRAERAKAKAAQAAEVASQAAERAALEGAPEEEAPGTSGTEEG